MKWNKNVISLVKPVKQMRYTKKFLFFIVYLELLSSCTDNSINNSHSAHEKDRKQMSPLKLPDFIKLSRGVGDAGKIYLQGVPKNDSAGPYIEKDVVSDSTSFTLLFYPKNGNKELLDFKMVNDGYNNNFRDLICFAFVYKMKTEAELKNDHEDNTIYPTLVKAYAKKDDQWNFVSQNTVNSLVELSQFEINTVYKVLREPS